MTLPRPECRGGPALDLPVRPGASITPLPVGYGQRCVHGRVAEGASRVAAYGHGALAGRHTQQRGGMARGTAMACARDMPCRTTAAVSCTPMRISIPLCLPLHLHDMAPGKRVEPRGQTAVRRRARQIAPPQALAEIMLVLTGCTASSHGRIPSVAACRPPYQLWPGETMTALRPPGKWGYHVTPPGQEGTLARHGPQGLWSDQRVVCDKWRGTASRITLDHLSPASLSKAWRMTCIAVHGSHGDSESTIDREV